jgi:hypothetical protein
LFRFQSAIFTPTDESISVTKELLMNYWIIAVIAGVGAVGGFMNVFIGDAGFHLPKTEDDVWQPGFLGVIVIGCIAAIGSWATLTALDLVGPNAAALTLKTGDIANALIIGFGGAKWFKSESEKDILQKTASIAAGKKGDTDAAMKIATATPMGALHAAMDMK